MKKQLHNNILHTKPLEGVDLYVYRTKTPGVSNIVGSFLGGDSFASYQKGLLPDMVAGLLDAGTQKHSKTEIREQIESLGASASFWCRGDRVGASLYSMPEDCKALLGLVGEELGSATFPLKEYALLVHQIRADLEEEKTDTKRVSQGEFLRTIYPKGHHNYMASIQDRLKMLSSISRNELVAFYKKHYGRGSMQFVAVGDIDHEELSKACKTTFRSLSYVTSVLPEKLSVAKTLAKESIVSIPDKTSVDMVLGASLPITKKHELYYPLMVVIGLLGANGFTSHLMQTVRERDGLTYGIRAGLDGFGDGVTGHWHVQASFAPSLFAKGRETTLREINWFLKNGLSDAAIERKKAELAGSYAVSLGTTSGIAQRILSILEEGESLEFLDTFPERLMRITPHEVREAAALINPGQVAFVAAGSIDRNGKPL